MFDYQKFKSSLKGFDKDEVLNYLEILESDHNKKVSDLEKEIKERDRMIAELKNRVAQKDEQRARLEEEINTKYKKYIENYDKIGSLVYESQLKADQMIAEAGKQAGEITANADREAEEIRAAAETDAASVRAEAQAEAQATVEEGRAKYARIQEILNDTLDIVNESQKRFMSNYRDVHALIQAAPGSLRELDERIGYDPAVYDQAEEEGAAEEEAYAEEDSIEENGEGLTDGEEADMGFETEELDFTVKKIVFDSDEEEGDDVPSAYRRTRDLMVGEMTAEEKGEEG